MSKPQVVFVLGGPGCGKGTQCAKIVETFGFTHLSAGDLLRAEMKSGSENGELISRMIKEGSIVPAEITVGLLRKAILSSDNTKFLVDGFPRNYDNNRVWTEVMADVADVKFVLYFTCTEEVMEKRCLHRGLTSGRTDDNAESIRKRFVTFHNESLPVIMEYEKIGKVKKIDATRTPEEIFEDVKKCFN